MPRLLMFGKVKAAVAVTAAAATIVGGTGAVAALRLAGGTPHATQRATATVRPGDIRVPTAEGGFTAIVPADTPLPPPRESADTTIAPPMASPAAATRTAQPAAATGTAAAPQTIPSPPAASAPAPVAAVGVARRTPSDAEIQQAITALPNYVRTVVRVSPLLVAEVGDQVCSAFDQGMSYTDIKETGLQALTQVPRTTVLPGGADWVIRTVVTMYCPGHLSKLP